MLLAVLRNGLFAAPAMPFITGASFAFRQADKTRGAKEAVALVATAIETSHYPSLSSAAASLVVQRVGCRFSTLVANCRIRSVCS